MKIPYFIIQLRRLFCYHEWIPSRYVTCEHTHEDCVKCGDFRVKGGQHE